MNLENEQHQTAISFNKAFRIGFGVNALNVKATLFFLFVYTAFLKVETPLWAQIVYGVYMAIATWLWFSLLSTIFGNKKVRSFLEHYLIWIERLMGALLILLAIKLLV